MNDANTNSNADLELQLLHLAAYLYFIYHCDWETDGDEWEDDGLIATLDRFWDELDRLTNLLYPDAAAAYADGLSRLAGVPVKD